MEILIELALELLLEGSVEVSKNEKVSKWIRYPIIALLGIVFIGMIALIIFIGASFFKENRTIGIVIILIGVALAIALILRIRNTYREMKKKKS